MGRLWLRKSSGRWRFDSWLLQSACPCVLWQDTEPQIAPVSVPTVYEWEWMVSFLLMSGSCCHQCVNGWMWHVMCIICRCGAWSHEVNGNQTRRRPWRPARPPTTTMRRNPDSWRERTKSYRRSSKRSAKPFLFFTLFFILFFPSHLKCKCQELTVTLHLSSTDKLFSPLLF